MFRNTVFFILSAMIFVSVFAEANTAPKCSAVLMFQKSEVKTNVTAIVKTVVAHQMKVNHGVQSDQTAYNEAIRQITTITREFPEMVEFYQSEMKRLTQQDTKIKNKIKSVVKKENDLKTQTKIEDNTTFLRIEDEVQIIFKKENGGYFVVGHNKELAQFIHQQKDIQQIFTNKHHNALAILKKDGTVVTWGHKDWGGDSSHLDLTNIKTIFSNGGAFVALKNNGDVVSWGHENWGGNSSHLELTNVKTIIPNDYAFAALKNDGTVISWGNLGFGGDSSHLNLTNVKTIFANGSAFAALKKNGDVVTWGHEGLGGLSSHLKLKNVKSITANRNAFAALLQDGTVLAWGNKLRGGDAPTVDLKNVQSIFSTNNAFAALLKDGTVVTWGDKNEGGESSHFDLTNVKYIFSTNQAFAALKYDGSVVTWGHEFPGGESSQLNLTNVESIYTTYEVFVALKKDATIVTWGNQDYGGDSSSVKDQLYDITHVIKVLGGSFIAHRKDGKYILWGKPIGPYENQVLNFNLF